MKEEIPGIPTTKPVEKQHAENLEDLKKSLGESFRLEVAQLKGKISALEAHIQKSAIPPTFLGPVKPCNKSFDQHIEEECMFGNVTFRQAFDHHMEMARESIQHAKFPSGSSRPNLAGIASNMDLRKSVSKTLPSQNVIDMRKSFAEGDIGKYEELRKSVLGDPADPSAPGSYYPLLEENLSRYIQRIMLENPDATALMYIPTAITSNIVPELAQLKSSGVGYGKMMLGFKEGATPQGGGGQIMDRITHTLVQQGIRASVTEMLIANRQKLVDNNPLALERELRVLEFNLQQSHDLLYGNSLIHKDGDTVLEISGFVEQIENVTTGYPAHVKDWDGVAFTTEGVQPLDIFRTVAEKLIINGHIPGGVITGKYEVFMDYGVANNFSTLIDDKQRVMINEYARSALIYGQSFSGFETDLGVFRFRRSKTLFLTQGDTWTPDDDVSPKAIIWPHAATVVTAIPGALDGEKPVGKADLPAGAYQYRVSVVNDQGESDISDVFVTTSEGTTPHAVDTTELVDLSIPYDSAFAGGVVAGETVGPARYFLLYRANAAETDDSQMSCIAKIPINGVSTTTYKDWNQKIPKTTDMFFISNNPMDIAQTSLTPTFEVPLWDIALGSTRQWFLMRIAQLTMWAPQRQFLYKNIPGFLG